MTIVLEHDTADMAKLLEEVSNTRSREALSIALEAAYAVGRRTGFNESVAMTKRILLGDAPTERPADCASNIQELTK